MMFGEDIQEITEALIKAASERGLMIATAESCTSGLIIASLTEIADSSAVVDRGFATYSNGAKQEMLGVPEAMLISHGAVSEPVARAMAEGALARSDAGLTVAVTGIAGPGGGSAEKPVGLVHFGCAMTGRETLHMAHVLPGDRQEVRLDTVRRALEMMLQRLK
jgi:nicotinamide-nucleotide amidase